MRVDPDPYRRIMDSYARAVSASALQGLLTGIWVAAGELTPAKRRATRAAAVVTLSAVASIRDWAFPDEEKEEETPRPPDKRQLLAVGAAAVFTTGMVIARRRLERRWLAGLERAGHPRPYRAVAVRMGLLSFAGTLPGRLVKAHEARRG